MARGGRRQGVQGRPYGNRTDLSMNAKPLPVMTATDQPYGVAGQQAAGQRLVPLAPPPGAAGGGAGGPTVAPRPAPGSLGAFDRPSDRPNEPLTAGAPLGAGPGPEALGLPTANPTVRLVSMLDTLARTSGSTAIAELARRAAQLKDG